MLPDEVVKQAGGVDKLGKTVVVGFYEHSLRTISTSRDAQTFVMHEIRNRATNERTRLINKQLEK